MKKICSNYRGFTLIELLLVMALLGTILTLATVNLFKPTAQAKIDSVSADVTAIIREAQNKAINTDTNGEATSNEYGVHFEAGKYTLFKGAVFNPTDPNNFVVAAPQAITIAANLPSNNVVFQRISGEVVSFDGARNTVCIRETTLNKTVLLRVNFVGVVDVLQQGC
jgi:prepilin-type N-terminal cleavage/methylation domain-containing protein